MTNVVRLVRTAVSSEMRAHAEGVGEREPVVDDWISDQEWLAGLPTRFGEGWAGFWWAPLRPCGPR
jgi:hypothetical protein